MTEAERFTRHFKALLHVEPDRAPGPSDLSELMGWARTRRIPGRLSKLRKRLLSEAGFVLCHNNGRYHPSFMECNGFHTDTELNRDVEVGCGNRRGV